VLKARSPFRALATALKSFAEYLTAGEIDAIEKAAAARRWNSTGWKKMAACRD
jgi:hypothetical protein